jgi:transposase-like protein
MERADLHGYLARGLSFEAIARLTGRDPSTIAYWARKHGQESPFAERHAARGPLPRNRLEALIEEGLTVREIAAEVERSPTTVRHWMRTYRLESQRARKPHTIVGISENGTIVAECPVHGATEHAIRGSGHLRCLQCRMDAVACRRRKVKEILVAEAGRCCAICGYDRSMAALEFHHIDPAEKEFHVSRDGISRSLAKARAEARKCVLLCSNCHVEVEGGLQAIPLDLPRGLPGPDAP